MYVCLWYVYFIVLSLEGAESFRLGCVGIGSEVFYCFIWRIYFVGIRCFLVETSINDFVRNVEMDLCELAVGAIVFRCSMSWWIM